MNLHHGHATDRTMSVPSDGSVSRNTPKAAHVPCTGRPPCRRPLPAGVVAGMVALCCAGSLLGQAPAPPTDINREFRAADLDPAAWVQRFEIESREVFVERAAIVAALDLDRGVRVADVGSGTGLFLAPLAAGVGAEGRVFTVDISPRLVAFVEQRIRDEALGNAVVILSTDTSTRLPARAVDRVLVCDTYHHFERPQAMLASIHAALVPGGTLVIVDFDRVPGVSREWLLDHVRADKTTVRAEIVAAGFEFTDEVPVPGFRENYLLRFRKPRAP